MLRTKHRRWVLAAENVKMVEIITQSPQLSNSVSAILNNCAKFVQNIIPQACPLCGSASEINGLCAPCHFHLPHHSAASCPVCALPTSHGDICGHCLKTAPAFNDTLAAFTYDFPVDSLVHALKYGGNLAIAGLLAAPLAALAKNRPKPDLLIPMPLHQNRIRERGFNQSLEIARILSRRFDIPVLASACQRTRDTVPQASLSLKLRTGNIRGAFICNSEDFRGKKIAIVDDVMTSGATINELSKELRKQGAAEISAWVVARAL